MPKIKFTKNDILNAAYDVMKQNGIKHISARRIAEKFKGSTAPIYANFSTIDELKKEVIRMAEEKLNEYLYRDYTGRELFDAAMGFIKFARDEKELFRAIFLDAAEGFSDLFDKTMRVLLKEEIVLKSFPKLSFTQAKDGIERLWVHLFGYATLVFVSTNPENETNEVIEEKINGISDYFKEVHSLKEMLMKHKEKS